MAFLILAIGRLDVEFRCIILYTVPPGEFGNKVLNIEIFFPSVLLHICFSSVGLLMSFLEVCCVLVVLPFGIVTFCQLSGLEDGSSQGLGLESSLIPVIEAKV